jgi:cytochrome c5
MTPTFTFAARAAATALALCAAAATFAQQAPSAPTATVWRNECGSCHVAFPARLLTAADWRLVMSRLDRHYGTDASIDSAAAGDIGRYLEAGAGRRSGGDDAGLPRITTGRWFVKEHRKVGAATFASPKVKSPVNCAACHANAAQGDFDDDDILIPR